jgi:hypothetical protein
MFCFLSLPRVYSYMFSPHILLENMFSLYSQGEKGSFLHSPGIHPAFTPFSVNVLYTFSNSKCSYHILIGSKSSLAMHFLFIISRSKCPYLVLLKKGNVLETFSWVITLSTLLCSNFPSFFSKGKSYSFIVIVHIMF